MRILLVTDAWFPQVNGVVTTYSRLRQELLQRGHEVELIAPHLFPTVPCPGYEEIRLAYWPGRRLVRMMDAARADAIHLATEGPLGFAARRYCVKRGLPFTSSYTTRFPEYFAARGPVPLSWGYGLMRYFHKPSRGIMVATKSIRGDLEARGFHNCVDWTRGVDTDLYRPRSDSVLDLPRPIHLYVGRITVEKNLEAFLDLDLPKGSKVLVGDGPQRKELTQKYPDAVFVGAKAGEELARHYASADVFVFPSRTDTFGLVMLEALACGLPVAAFPVPGPIDILDGHGVGVLDEDLGYAIEQALKIPASRCRAFSQRYSWGTCTEMFLRNLHPIPAESRRAA